MRAAVLGASGFGRFHVRELQCAGAEVTAILGSTPATAAETAAALQKEFGCVVTPHHDLRELLASQPDVVSVCTPHALHFDQVVQCLRTPAFVLCEKPLIWPEKGSSKLGADQLRELARLGAEERLGLNTLNVLFLDELARRDLLPARLHSFVFEFHTQGRFTHADIAVDLLPHALSSLLRIAPEQLPRNLRREFRNESATFQFDWGQTACRFDFRERPDGDKRLAWVLNGKEYRREATASEASYTVGLRDVCRDAAYPIADPLATLIGNFLSFARGHAQRPTVDFASAARIQRGMSRLMQGVRRKAVCADLTKAPMDSRS